MGLSTLVEKCYRCQCSPWRHVLTGSPLTVLKQEKHFCILLQCVCLYMCVCVCVCYMYEHLCTCQRQVFFSIALLLIDTGFPTELEAPPLGYMSPFPGVPQLEFQLGTGFYN